MTDRLKAQQAGEKIVALLSDLTPAERQNAVWITETTFCRRCGNPQPRLHYCTCGDGD